MDIYHVHDGKVIWEDHDLPNILHSSGEVFILSAVFTGGISNTFIPQNYFVGLDARNGVNYTDTLQQIFNEPNGNGYARQPVSSTSGFTIQVVNGVHRAVGSIVTFSAAVSGGGYGPVNNIFMATVQDNNPSGFLISSVPLSSPVVFAPGDAVNMRMSMSLKNC
jgi:hypothetical protein